MSAITRKFEIKTGTEGARGKLLKSNFLKEIAVAKFHEDGAIKGTGYVTISELKNLFECEIIKFSEEEELLINLIKDLLSGKINGIYTKIDPKNDRVKIISLKYDSEPEIEMRYDIV